MPDERYCIVSKKDGSRVVLDDATMTFSYLSEDLRKRMSEGDLKIMMTELNKLGKLLKKHLLDKKSITTISAAQRLPKPARRRAV